MNQSHPTPEQLVEYLHGELPPPQDAAVHAHLAECSVCAQAYGEEASLGELLRAHARSEERDIPYRVVVGIREAVANAHAAGFRERLRSAFRPFVVIPVAAAALAVALYLGIGARHPSGATPIGAAYYLNDHAALTATTPFSEDAPIPAMLTSDESSGDQRTVDQPP